MVITIDGRKCEFTAGQTVYEVAKANGIHIPVLCHHEQIKPVGACRVCVVEVEKARSLVASCAMPAEDGMVVHTSTPRVLSSRKLSVELLMTQGHHNCITCNSGDCVLQDLAYSLGISRAVRQRKHIASSDANEMIVRDGAKCVLCGLCVRACNEVRSIRCSTTRAGTESNGGPLSD